MSELLQVACALMRASHEKEVGVLATVVRTEGSTYRRIGARLMAFPDGSHVGSVSAGCIERDVLLRAECDAAVVMSHNYEWDLVQVQALLAAGVAYVGVLGPRRRADQMVDVLGVSEADAARLHAPVGLDIGAETPEEVALTIAAEVLAVMTGHRGAPLRDRPGAIHDTAQQVFAREALVAQAEVITATASAPPHEGVYQYGI